MKIKHRQGGWLWVVLAVLAAVLLVFTGYLATTVVLQSVDRNKAQVALSDNLIQPAAIKELPVKQPTKPSDNPATPTQPQRPTAPQQPVQPIAGRVVYLTFDDGPSENTAAILDILTKYNAKATFFVTGNGQNYNHLIKRAHNEGHAIGLHTYSHNYAKVYASDDAYFDDLNRVSDMVNNLLGYRPNLIRFPGGSSNTVSRRYSSGIMSRLTKAVRAAGYQYFDWNCSSEDATGNNVPVSRIVASSKCSPKQVVLLMHDARGKGTTVQALPQIIEYYQSRGYSFAPLTTDSFAAHHRVNN